MEPMENALPAAGPAKPAQTAPKLYEIHRRDRLVLAGTLAWCLFAVDIVLWRFAMGMGFTALVFAWYALVLAAFGLRVFARPESCWLLVTNLALGASFALTSSPAFRVWNLLALLVLVPLHATSLSGGATLPWWRPAMLFERLGLFLGGLFGALGAAFAALIPAGKGHNTRRIATVVCGIVGAAALLAVLVPVLASADLLFAAATESLRRFIRDHFTQALWKLMLALVATPFFFGLLYRLRRPNPAKPFALKLPTADTLLFLILLAALDGLYLLFLAVQSAGLFGGAAFLSARGISYAEWARSGFFQMVGVTILNLTVLLTAVTVSRREGRGWAALRILATVLTAESLVLLASALWRMSLYVAAYGLSFKRCMTYWGMGMMALFFLVALRKIWRPEASFCRWAFPLALAGWLVINCVPINFLVATNQVDRYLSGASPQLSVEYLVGLSFDTLPALERLAGMTVPSSYHGGVVDMTSILAAQSGHARRQCADWRTWNLSACLAAGWE